MKLKHFSDTDWHKDHPTGTVVFQYCLEGDPMSPENFMLVLGRQDGDFYMPRHRHNFEQIRLPLVGDMNIGEGLKLKKGQVGYFPGRASAARPAVRRLIGVRLHEHGAAAGRAGRTGEGRRIRRP
jgi:hypothetical protein